VKRLLVVTGVICAVCCSIPPLWAQGAAGNQSRSLLRIQDTNGDVRGGRSEDANASDVLTLKNGKRVDGLIADENDTQVTLVRYAGTAPPYRVGFRRCDIVRIQRVGPERRALMEAKVRELTYNAHLARQRAEAAAAQRRAAQTAWRQSMAQNTRNQMLARRYQMQRNAHPPAVRTTGPHGVGQPNRLTPTRLPQRLTAVPRSQPRSAGKG